MTGIVGIRPEYPCSWLAYSDSRRLVPGTNDVLLLWVGGGVDNLLRHTCSLCSGRLFFPVAMNYFSSKEEVLRLRIAL